MRSLDAGSPSDLHCQDSGGDARLRAVSQTLTLLKKKNVQMFEGLFHEIIDVNSLSNIHHLIDSYNVRQAG
jgi:hypothetical protein